MKSCRRNRFTGKYVIQIYSKQAGMGVTVEYNIWTQPKGADGIDVFTRSSIINI